MKPEAEKKEWLDAWHVNPSINKDYLLIDGLRGIAILMVVACHHVYVNPSAGNTVKFLCGIFAAGSSGVTVFFALSGFLIAWPFWKRKFNRAESSIPRGYGWRRFYKIYPPLALSILLLTPVYILKTNDWSFCQYAAKWFAGLPLVMPVSGKLNPVMWSLAAEVQFYLFLPVLFVLARRLRDGIALWALPLALLILGMGSTLLYKHYGMANSLSPDVIVRFPTFMDSFAFGVFIAGLENYWGKLPRKWAIMGDLGFVLLIGGMIMDSWTNLHPMKNTALHDTIINLDFKISAVFLLCYVADPMHPRSRLLCAPWLRWCGLISYEWYLFHQPIALWARSYFGPASGHLGKYVLLLGGACVTSLVIGALVYLCFSLPILKSGRGKHAPTQA